MNLGGATARGFIKIYVKAILKPKIIQLLLDIVKSWFGYDTIRISYKNRGTIELTHEQAAFEIGES